MAEASNRTTLLHFSYLIYNCIEQLWIASRSFCKLKWVNLKGSQNLIKTPDFTMASNLECLILEDCIGIVDIHPSIGVLRRLKLLNLRGCKSLRILPPKIRMESLETLILSGCLNLQMFPEMDEEKECLLEIYLDGTVIKKLPSSIRYLRRLKLLNLRDCKSLRSLPTKIIGVESLEKLILSCCSNLERFPEIDCEMKCLLELYLDGTGIKGLPSSIGRLSNLVLLNLKDCSNLVSLSSSIDGCKCLKTLNLSSCSKLETLPENLQQVEFLEELDLSETAIRKPPSFIFQFKNLKVLSFKGCKGPPSKLQPIWPSLFKALQRGSSDSMALLLPSLSGLSSLTELNLSDCNLWEGAIPSDICYLSSLEKLFLSGNNFMSLPATLAQFSKLEYLDLSDCRRLKSLSDVLTRIRSVTIDGCSSLEVIANPSTICSSFRSSYILGTDFYRLAENSNALTMLKEYIKVFANKRQRFDILIPGSEIPEWFNHRRESSSIKIPLPPNIQNDSQWMGVALCGIFVFAFNDDDAWEQNEETIVLHTKIFGSNSREVECSGFVWGRKHSQQRAVKDHLWLRYLSRDKILSISLEDKRGETENLLCVDWANQEGNEIEFSMDSDEVVSAEVKKCGVRIVYEKDLEEMEEIDEQHSSPTNCADIDDIHQDIADDHGLIGNGGVLVKRKRNIYEEAGPSDQSDSPEERPHPKRLEKFFNFMMGKKY